MFDLDELKTYKEGNPKASKVLDDFWNAALSEDKVSARFMKDSDRTTLTLPLVSTADSAEKNGRKKRSKAVKKNSMVRRKKS